MNLPISGEKESLWTKNYIAMIVLSLFLSISLNMTGTVTPLYARDLGGDLSTLGLVMAFFTVSALVFRPYFGSMLDKKGRKLTIIVGGVIFSVVTLIYGFAYSVTGLLVLRFLHGLGFSAHSTAAGTVVADIVPKSRLTEGVGFFGISHTLAMAIGPLIGLNLMEHMGYTSVFVFAAILGAASVLVALIMQLPDEKKLQNPSGGMKQTKNAGKNGYVEITAIPSAFVMLFIALTFGGIFTFLPAFAISRGIGDIGIFFTVFALIQLVTRPLMGKIADKYGFTTVMVPGLIFMAISMTLLVFAYDISMMIAAGLAYGLGFGSTQPTLNAIMIKLCPAERRGVGNATFFSAMDIGIGSGAIVWGMVSQLAGFAYVFVGSAICILISLVLYIAWLRRQLKENGYNVVSIINR